MDLTFLFSLSFISYTRYVKCVKLQIIGICKNIFKWVLILCTNIMLIIEKYTTAIVLETVESRWTEIFYFASSTRSHFSESVTVDFPSRCNYGIIALEDISPLRLPFHLGSIYSSIFDTNRLNSFYRRIFVRERVCVRISPFFDSVKTPFTSFAEDIPLLIWEGNRDIKDSIFVFLIGLMRHKRL